MKDAKTDFERAKISSLEPYSAEEDAHLRAWNVVGPDGQITTCPGKYAEEEARFIAEQLNVAYRRGLSQATDPS